MKGRHLSIIAKKEFRGLFNEKTILLAVLLQLFIALFSSFLMVGLTSMYDPSSLSKYSRYRYSVAYAGNESELLTYLERSPDFRVYQMDLSTAVAALGQRKLAAVIYVPDTPPDAVDPIKITLYTVQMISRAQSLMSNSRTFPEIRADPQADTRGRLDVQPVPLQIPASTGGGDFYELCTVCSSLSWCSCRDYCFSARDRLNH